MQDLVERYLAQGVVEGRAPATTKAYRRHLAIMLTVLRRRACRRFPDVTPADLEALMQDQADLGKAKDSRVGLACTVRRFFTWLQDHGHVVGNSARGIAVPDEGEPDLPAPPLSEQEVTNLIDALPRATVIDLRNRSMIEIMYGCALRVSEVVDLNTDDIDQARRTLTVRRGKGGYSARVLPIMETALAAVRDYLSVRRSQLRGPDTGALLLNQYGRRISVPSIHQWFMELNRRRGPALRHLHPHLLRASLAVHALRGGADIRHVQAILGHARLDTTKIYLRMLPGDLKIDYDKAMPDIEVGLHLSPKGTST